MTRDTSGTGWQPDLSNHGGLHSAVHDLRLAENVRFDVGAPFMRLKIG